jgi:hypothetical protein
VFHALVVADAHRKLFSGLRLRQSNSFSKLADPAAHSSHDLFGGLHAQSEAGCLFAKTLIKDFRWESGWFF